jgi:DivIVA domain-containing protein
MEREPTGNDVREIAFTRPPLGKRGYHEQDVDDFLDAIEIQLRARECSPGAAADRAMKPATANTEESDATNDRVADSAAAADAAWFAAKFGSTHPSVATPDADPPRGDVPDDKVAIPPVSAWRAVAFDRVWLDRHGMPGVPARWFALIRPERTSSQPTRAPKTKPPTCAKNATPPPLALALNKPKFPSTSW